MTKRFVKYLFSAVLLSILLLAYSSTHAVQTKCPAGSAWSSVDRTCIRCNRPCKTESLGQCRHGIMDCTGDQGRCVSVLLPGTRAELCDRMDNDCDGKVDEGFDKDADGYATCGGDCNDRDPLIYPDRPEKCDGIDNDCDGHIDEPFKVGRRCYVGVGACRVSGTWRCRSDQSGAMCNASPGEPSREICDGIDNDCDGDVDEGLGEQSCGVGACAVTVPVCANGKPVQCEPRTPTREICGDKIDNNCNGEVDEGFEKLGEKCSAGVGACRRTGAMVCGEDKLSLVCTAVAGAPRKEVCGNRIDDNCDGEVDNVKGLGKPCDNGQLGACKREGKYICDRAKGALACSAKRVEPKKEICDGTDNDCDGAVDEDLMQTKSCGMGVCEGGTTKRVCSKGEWKPWSTCSTDNKKREEICDGLDNDCDGKIDEELTKIQDCGLGVCEGGTSKQYCEKGKWAPWTECSTAKRAGDEVCDEKDNDCDGEVDEGVKNACGGCPKLKHKPGDPCLMPGGDECAIGSYACRKDDSGLLECTPDFSRSEGSACTPDDNMCTSDRCRDGKCRHLAVRDGTPCFDVNACTSDDICIDGACAGSSQLQCNDNNPCTEDFCEPKMGCVFARIGEGRINECGGCDRLMHEVGGSCVLGMKKGPCSKGAYRCLPDNGLECVQTIFPLEERCNGMDDDCNGAMDDKLEDISCGEGACRVTVASCRDGRPTVCVPLEPSKENCNNMGTDDDCNGIVDDVPNLGARCGVVIADCVVPGIRKCVEEVTPTCVIRDQNDAADDDDDGVPNHCDSSDLAAVDGNIPPRGSIQDVTFDGHRGLAQFTFSDPDGGAVAVKFDIRASHGGSIDEWIDKRGLDEIGFSIKGDPNALGLWPVAIVARATDEKGATIESTAILNRNGTIESIRNQIVE